MLYLVISTLSSHVPGNVILLLKLLNAFELTVNKGSNANLCKKNLWNIKPVLISAHVSYNPVKSIEIRKSPMNYFPFYTIVICFIPFSRV